MLTNFGGYVALASFLGGGGGRSQQCEQDKENFFSSLGLARKKVEVSLIMRYRDTYIEEPIKVIGDS